jgi:DNA primase
MSKEDIEKHRIGYCGLGYYKWRIIIPAIEDGEIRYFSARLFLGQGERYRNPKKEECGVGANEVVFNIDSARSLNRAILVEGCFDAIRVGSDGVALFGKHVSDHQVLKLLNIENIYVMLDQDALIDSLDIVHRFLEKGKKNVYLVSPPHGDPSDWPRAEIRKWITAAKRFTFEDEFG